MVWQSILPTSVKLPAVDTFPFKRERIEGMEIELSEIREKSEKVGKEIVVCHRIR